MTARSLSTQSVLVFVKNLTCPVFLKNPIAGSNIIFLSEIFDFLTIFKLSEEVFLLYLLYFQILF